MLILLLENPLWKMSQRVANPIVQSEWGEITLVVALNNILVVKHVRYRLYLNDHF